MSKIANINTLKCMEYNKDQVQKVTKYEDITSPLLDLLDTSKMFVYLCRQLNVEFELNEEKKIIDSNNNFIITIENDNKYILTNIKNQNEQLFITINKGCHLISFKNNEYLISHTSMINNEIFKKLFTNTTLFSSDFINIINSIEDINSIKIIKILIYNKNMSILLNQLNINLTNKNKISATNIFEFDINNNSIIPYKMKQQSE